MCRKKKKSWGWWEWEVTAEITDKIWSLKWTLEWHYQRLEEEQHHQSLRGGTSSKTGGGANRLVQARLHVRKEKYYFCFMFLFRDMEMTRTVYILWKRKKQDVLEAPCPRNVQEFESFLGLISFYGKFLPNLVSTPSPLYCPLHKEIQWQWITTEQQAFQKAKELLTFPCVIVHFNPSFTLTLD